MITILLVFLGQKLSNMKFIVSRTSVWKSDITPCEEAKREEFEDGPDWTIEINSLEELIAFRKKYGELVLTASVIPEIDNEIEIYDDYRE